MKRFCIVGSLNYDVSISSPEFPKPGETIKSTGFILGLGGKGGNQAAALAKLGAAVSFVGAVGADAFGESYIKELRGYGVDTSGIAVLGDVSTGVAVIEVNGAGQNTIVLHAGANGRVTPEFALPRIPECDCILLQNEIPLSTNLAVTAYAAERGIPVVLDPAPASADFPPELFKNLAYVTPNETECETITGIAVKDDASALAAAEKFFALGVKHCVLKRGKDGVTFITKGQRPLNSPSFNELPVVDTTAAGDTFNGAFAYAVGLGKSPSAACLFANAAAGLAVGKRGAQSSSPTLKEVEALLSSYGLEF